MAIDLEAIREHVDADNDGQDYHDCATCRENQTALIAEVERLYLEVINLRQFRVDAICAVGLEIAALQLRRPADIEKVREAMGCDCIDKFIAAGGKLTPGAMIPCEHRGYDPATLSRA